MRFELAGAAIALRGLDKRDARAALAELDPYVAIEDADADADIVVNTTDVLAPHFDDLQNAAADGRVTGWDGARFHLIEGGRACALPRLDAGTPFRFDRERAFPLRPLVRSLLRPALQLAVLEHGRVAVHGTAVQLDGDGIVVAGWSESGKTETALAFMERGAAFVSDKWTILAGAGELAPFPISVGIRRWVLPFLPRLRRALPRAARRQLALAGAASAVTRPLRGRAGSGNIGRVAATAAERAVALAERAALTPSEVSRAYGAEAPLPRARLRTMVLLTTVPGSEVSVRAADSEWAARRLARSASYERRGFFELHRRTRYAVADAAADLEAAVERREEEELRGLLGGVSLLEARAPFPTDPRQVADAITAHL